MANSHNIAQKKWGEVYKRVIVLVKGSNAGITDEPAVLASGDGVESVLSLSDKVVRIKENSKLEFGSLRQYIKQVNGDSLLLVARQIMLSGTVLIERGELGSMEVDDLQVNNMLKVDNAEFKEIKVGRAVIEEQVNQTAILAKHVEADSLKITGTDATIDGRSVLGAIDGCLCLDE